GACQSDYPPPCAHGSQHLGQPAARVRLPRRRVRSDNGTDPAWSWFSSALPSVFEVDSRLLREAPMALCSQSDIEALRQIDFTNDPDGTVAQIIRLAEGILEGVTGRSFTPVVDEVVLADGLRQTDGLIWLETFPVTAVAVSAADGSSYTVNTHFTWDRSGRIRRLGHGGQAWTWTWQYEPWTGPAWPKGTTITFSGGASDPDDVPGDLRMLCAEVAADLFDKGAARSEEH